MNKTIASYISLILIMIVGFFYYYGISRSGGGFGDSDVVSYKYFPTLLTIFLFIFCIISLIETFKANEHTTVNVNFKLLFITVGLLVIYFLSWSILKTFYFSTFLLLLGLLFIYGKKDNFKKNLVINILISLVMVISIYILFERLINIKF